MVSNKDLKNFKKNNLFILNIISNNFLNKFVKNKNYALIETKKNFFDLIKNEKKSEKYFYLVINFKSFNLFKIIFLLMSINNNLKIKKNFFIFFGLKKEYVGYNFFPDWPRGYLSLNFFESLIVWTKKFIFIFINFKKIKYLIIKKK